MLFLRDIDADVQLRCRGCGHGGVLPRAMLERRFGPNYPVLSIAPHYRCSRCDSRDIESRPILSTPPAAHPAAVNDEPSFDAPLAALNGLLASLRSGSGEDSRGREETAVEPPAPPPASPPVLGKRLSDLPLSDLVADGPADDGAVPLWEPVSLADMAARLGRAGPSDEESAEDADDWDDDRTAANDAWPEPGLPGNSGTRDVDDRDSAEDDSDDGDGADETLTAMRRLLAQAYGSDDDQDDGEPDPYADGPVDGKPLRGGLDWDDRSGDEPPVFSPNVLVRRNFEDDWDDDPDSWRAEAEDDRREDGFDEMAPDGAEPSDDEILSFAIRDPEKPAPASVPVSNPAKPSLRPAGEPLDFDQHRAERRAQRPPPPPEDEEGYDRTLAALRSMIEDAATEPEEDEAPPPPRKVPRNADKPVHREVARRKDEDDLVPDRDEDDGWSPPTGRIDPDPVPEPAPAGRRSAQEREIEEAMKALRELVEDEVQQAPQSPPPQPKPRAGKPRPPANVQPPDAGTGDAGTGEETSAKPAPDPTPLSKTIAALRGMLELDGRRKR
ncbi:hypothetical protein JHL17_16235 [Azospirillum sp. YIM B02556]|uniref:Uncharacterized protein n=1 Tax=Azospirillum endophyticum TaxID=2800326 RepID=A0ABS1F6D4_9PROT|nr:hypothetical protein [Azospirillum endophyticum]MBK1838966.1 hypothetical protein [Azospirillum endophyticum]